VGIREIIAAVRAMWWLPILGLVGGALAGLGLSLAQTPMYTTNVQLFVSSSANGENADVYTSFIISQARITSYTRLLSGKQLSQAVIDQLDLDSSPGALSSQISAVADRDTVLIDVSVTDPVPERATQIAEAIGDQFPRLVEKLEDVGSGSLVKVTVTDPPEVPTEPSSPQTSRNVTLGLAVGLLVGIALAIFRMRLDRSIKRPEDAAALSGAPVIGMVLRDESLEKGHVIDRLGANRTAEDYRQLRTNLQFLGVDEPPKVIMVSSAIPSEGKTTVVVNLALALADTGRRVTIVEADLRRPKVTRYLGMVGGAGLTNVLAGTAEVAEVLQRYGEGDLWVLAAGPHPPNPGELLASSQMSALLEKLRAENEYVLLDSPPLLPVADASGLAAHVDGVLLSVRYGRTRRDQVEQAAATLDRVGAVKLGTILNIVPPRAEMATAYGYGYGYGYENKGAHKQ
jgi:receptor protein-tyrosine kinase